VPAKTVSDFLTVKPSAGSAARSKFTCASFSRLLVTEMLCSVRARYKAYLSLFLRSSVSLARPERQDALGWPSLVGTGAGLLSRRGFRGRVASPACTHGGPVTGPGKAERLSRPAPMHPSRCWLARPSALAVMGGRQLSAEPVEVGRAFLRERPSALHPLIAVGEEL
jgi:hypothetical protein